MDQQEKLLAITNWFKEFSNEDTKDLSGQKDFRSIEAIENLVDEKLPKEIIELYERFDASWTKQLNEGGTKIITAFKLE